MLEGVSRMAESNDYEFGGVLSSLEYRQKNILSKLKNMGRQNAPAAGSNILQSFVDNLKNTEEEVRKFDAEIKLNATNEYLDSIFDNLQLVEREVRGMSEDLDQMRRRLDTNGR